MHQPKGVILRLVKEPRLGTEWLKSDDGLVTQEWTEHRYEALEFPTYEEADNRAQVIRLRVLSCYAAVVVAPSVADRLTVHDKDFSRGFFGGSPNGPAVLAEEMRRRREQRRRRQAQRSAETRAADLAELDRVAGGVQ